MALADSVLLSRINSFLRAAVAVRYADFFLVGLLLIAQTIKTRERGNPRKRILGMNGRSVRGTVWYEHFIRPTIILLL